MSREQAAVSIASAGRRARDPAMTPEDLKHRVQRALEFFGRDPPPGSAQPTEPPPAAPLPAPFTPPLHEQLVLNLDETSRPEGEQS